MGCRVHVIITSPGQASRRVTLEPRSADGAILIGRAQDCDLRLDDPDAAERHCRLRASADGAVIENLDAAGWGTTLNGEDLREARALRSGDKAVVGQTTLVFEVEGSGRPASRPSSRPVIPPPAPAGQPPHPRPAPPNPAPATPTPRTPGSAGRIPAPAPPRTPRPAPPDHAPPTPPARAIPASTPHQPPKPAAPAPSASAAPAPPAAGPVDRVLASAREEYHPRCLGRFSEREWRSMLHRGLERATGYGFQSDEEREGFLRCVLLTGDELVGPETPAWEVYYALTNPAWGSAERIQRAMKQAQRFARSALGVDPLSRAGEAPGAASVSAQRPPAAPASEPARRTRPSVGARHDDPTVQELERSRTEDRFAPSPRPAESGDGDEPPPEIEGYEYLAPLGGGGMGRVFKYRDLKLECEVAIKVVRSHFQDAHRQIQAEAQSAAKLKHPNVVPVMGYREDARRGYYIMQFVKGKDSHKLVQDCAARLAARESLDDILRIAEVEPQAAQAEVRAAAARHPPYYCVVAAWIAGAAEGLGAAHMAHVVHRDVKPSNLIIGCDGRMMIADFGLATTAYDSSSGGSRVGTPRYLAPETVAEWAGGTPLPPEPGIDIWGLGATLYELLALAPAYPGRGSEALVLRDIVTRDPTPPRQVRWDVPERLEEICLRALRRNPDDRYRSMGEFAADLRDWIDRAGRSGSARRGEPRTGGRWPWR